MDEIIDIVDDNDNVIGSESKSRCHSNCILHRGANLLIFRDNSFREILIQKRSMKKERAPGAYCTPGGHLKSGECYSEAAKREFFEEMHNKSYGEIELEELFRVQKLTGSNNEFITVFRGVAQGPFNPDPEEVEDYFFEDIDNVMEKIDDNFTQTTAILLKKYMELHSGWQTQAADRGKSSV